MARLPRLELPGLPHYVIQRGHNREPVLAAPQDRRHLIEMLRELVRGPALALHAWALADEELHLLVTPAAAGGLGRAMQSLGRRFATDYNRRHGRSGALWDGRFRAAVIEPGEAVLDVMCLIDSAGSADGPDPERSSAAHHLGLVRDPAVQDPPEYWGLGNTPFDREVAFRARLGGGVPRATRDAVRHAAMHGWAYGTEAFLARLAGQTGRPLRPRARGRPRTRAEA